ncbi:2'-5' RNA ligase family protein [Roseomonas sp. OT10]|uniref:2'-5' RNA ligase family protein n=1 Tax=Roseomonas cutis TaxID=2897332 RepID=UPI001E426D52|nr:2'-5' RNA ligase family protein [Roseomonas sp. OT10]UFN47044.1 2'-5' RNA ligase family protein [Roseomonas sp. OT10]
MGELLLGEPPTGEAPLIVSLRLDPASFARLDALRRAHFPAERNHLSAHLTLFHALPGAAEAEVAANLATLAAATPPMPLDFPGLRSLGRGVAVTVDSLPLVKLRGLLAGAWHGWLGPQDRQGWRPHVTVQNKVAPAAARTLLAALEQGFAPWSGRGEGLLLWRYRGGPWAAAGEFPFLGERAAG